jgi:hypothetical protein
LSAKRGKSAVEEEAECKIEGMWSALVQPGCKEEPHKTGARPESAID